MREWDPSARGKRAAAMRRRSGVDQRAGIHAALGNDAAERRINVLEGFQFFEAPHIGFRGSYVGDFGFLITDGVIDFLLGDAVGLDQFLVTRCGDLGEIGVGLRGIEFGARLKTTADPLPECRCPRAIHLAGRGCRCLIPLF